jgi:hypothetical protein
MGYDPVYFGIEVPTLRRKLLPPSSHILETVAADVSPAFVLINPLTLHNIQKYRYLNFRWGLSVVIFC